MDEYQITNQEKNQPGEKLEPKVSSIAKFSASKLFFLGLVIGSVVCSLAAGLGVYFFLRPKEEKVKIQTDKITNEIPTPTPTSVSQVTPATSLLWLDKPQQLSSVLVFKKSSELPEVENYYFTDEAKFFKVATFSDGSSLIKCVIPKESYGGGSNVDIVRFKETKDKKYYYLVNYLDEWSRKDLAKILLPGVLPESIKVEGLESPEIIEYGNIKFVKVRTLDESFDALKNPKKITDSPFGPIYEDFHKIIQESDEILARSLYLRLKDDTLVSYKLKVDFYSDNGAPEIFLNEKPGVKNQTVFSQKMSNSCSSSEIDSVPIIRDGSPLIAGKKEIGKTSKGDLIFQVFEPSSELVQIIYKYYSESRNYEGGPKIETLEKMAAENNHFLWKDPLGDWQIFLNNKYETFAECGKPVIYLYPTQPTKVNIKVGAIITNSDPEYKENGWEILAYPNGTLIHNGQQYNSLFWEGLGRGPYPDLKNYGFVVSKENLPTVLKDHLSKLGLNQKESSDFLEFWLPKMPKTPYTRLTWFGTREMETLAPLEVMPKPDTKIRIFLDFEGLEKPIPLKSQKLSAPNRIGFTLVEWGGLLIGNHQ